MLGFQGMRLMMFQLSGFYCRPSIYPLLDPKCPLFGTISPLFEGTRRVLNQEPYHAKLKALPELLSLTPSRTPQVPLTRALTADGQNPA